MGLDSPVRLIIALMSHGDEMLQKHHGAPTEPRVRGRSVVLPTGLPAGLEWAVSRGMKPAK